MLVSPFCREGSERQSNSRFVLSKRPKSFLGPGAAPLLHYPAAIWGDGIHGPWSGWGCRNPTTVTESPSWSRSQWQPSAHTLGSGWCQPPPPHFSLPRTHLTAPRGHIVSTCPLYVSMTSVTARGQPPGGQLVLFQGPIPLTGNYIHKHPYTSAHWACTRRGPTALFMIEKNQKWPKCPSERVWLNKPGTSHCGILTGFKE